MLCLSSTVKNSECYICAMTLSMLCFNFLSDYSSIISLLLLPPLLLLPSSLPPYFSVPISFIRLAINIYAFASSLPAVFSSSAALILSLSYASRTFTYSSCFLSSSLTISIASSSKSSRSLD